MKKTRKLVTASVVYMCLLIVSFLLSPHSAQASYSWSALIGAGQRNWTSINASQDGSKILITTSQSGSPATGNGYIYTSENGGITWVQRTSAGLRSWGPAAMSGDGTKIAAFPYAGYMFTSNDSGQTWTERTATGRQQYWTDVAMSRDGNTIVGSSPQGLIISSDGGENWRIETIDTSRDHKLSISADGSKIVAVSSNGFIHISTDGGYNWSTYFGDARRFWRNVKISADGMKIVVIQGWNYIYTSNDGGASWTTQTSAGLRNWYAISASDDGSKIIASAEDYIYVSTDSGATWSQEPNQGGGYWYDVAISGNGNKLFGLKQGGYLYAGVQTIITAPIAISAQNTSVGAAGIVNNVLVSYPVTFSFSVTAGNNGIYISSNPATAFDTTNTGYSTNPNSYTSLTSILTSPNLLSGDTNGSYFVPAGATRWFTVRGNIMAGSNMYGVRTFSIRKIYYGDSALDIHGHEYSQGLDNLKATAAFGIFALPGSTDIKIAPPEIGDPTPVPNPTPIVPEKSIKYEWNQFIQQYQALPSKVKTAESLLTSSIWNAIREYVGSWGM